MSNIKKSILELVGHTPLVELGGYVKKHELKATLLGKLEYFNPTGSVKDRAAVAMIEKAEAEGKIKPGDTIFEVTSGNTGIGLAAFAAAKGYKLKVFLEPGVTIERTQILKAYGVEFVTVEDVPGVGAALASGKVDNITDLFDEFERYCAAQETTHFFINQIANPANPEAHYTGTGPEIWEDTDGNVDILVALAGTAGTLSGVGRYLKEQNPNLKIYAVQPAIGSRLFTNPPAENTIDGVVAFDGEGALSRPVFIDDVAFEEVLNVTALDAYETGRQLAQTDGIFLGQSAAAALNAATLIAKRPENEGKNIVIMMADNGMKYLSTNMYK